jgi:hypothetical protein
LRRRRLKHDERMSWDATSTRVRSSEASQKYHIPSVRFVLKQHDVNHNANRDS